MNLINITTTPLIMDMQITNAKYEYVEDAISPIQEVSTSCFDEKERYAKKRVTDGFSSKIDNSSNFSVVFNGYSKSNDTKAMNTRASPISAEERYIKSNSLAMPFFMNHNVVNDGNRDMYSRYKADKAIFDVKLKLGQYQFTPANIETTIVQYPKVTIEYIGGFQYVPKSSDPNLKAEI